MNFFTNLFTRARLASGHTQAPTTKPVASRVQATKADRDPVALAYRTLSPRVARHVARSYRAKPSSEDASLSFT